MKKHQKSRRTITQDHCKNFGSLEEKLKYKRLLHIAQCLRHNTKCLNIPNGSVELLNLLS